MDWIDVKDQLHECAESALTWTEPLLCDPDSLDLAHTMSAALIGHPKMDSGFVPSFYTPPAPEAELEQALTLFQCDCSGSESSSSRSEADGFLMAALLDTWMAIEWTFYDGSPFAQTLDTSIHIRHWPELQEKMFGRIEARDRGSESDEKSKGKERAEAKEGDKGQKGSHGCKAEEIESEMERRREAISQLCMNDQLVSAGVNGLLASVGLMYRVILSADIYDDEEFYPDSQVTSTCTIDSSQPASAISNANRWLRVTPNALVREFTMLEQQVQVHKRMGGALKAVLARVQLRRAWLQLLEILADRSTFRPARVLKCLDFLSSTLASVRATRSEFSRSMWDTDTVLSHETATEGAEDIGGVSRGVSGMSISGGGGRKLVPGIVTLGPRPPMGPAPPRPVRRLTCETVFTRLERYIAEVREIVTNLQTMDKSPADLIGVLLKFGNPSNTEASSVLGRSLFVYRSIGLSAHSKFIESYIHTFLLPLVHLSPALATGVEHYATRLKMVMRQVIVVLGGLNLSARQRKIRALLLDLSHLQEDAYAVDQLVHNAVVSSAPSGSSADEAPPRLCVHHLWVTSLQVRILLEHWRLGRQLRLHADPELPVIVFLTHNALQSLDRVNEGLSSQLPSYTAHLERLGRSPKQPEKGRTGFRLVADADLEADRMSKMYYAAVLYTLSSLIGSGIVRMRGYPFGSARLTYALRIDCLANSMRDPPFPSYTSYESLLQAFSRNPLAALEQSKKLLQECRTALTKLQSSSSNASVLNREACNPAIQTAIQANITALQGPLKWLGEAKTSSSTAESGEGSAECRLQIVFRYLEDVSDMPVLCITKQQ